MNRRQFLKSLVSAGAVAAAPAPLLALAEAEPLVFDGLQYLITPYSVGTYGGMQRLSTPMLPYNPEGGYLTAQLIRDFIKRMEDQLS